MSATTHNIKGVYVDFPFQPYPSQHIFMERVIDALQTNSDALLESPTGTGKTVCLLSATLAWQNYEAIRGTASKVIYCSRTHSQISQVVKQLRGLNIKPKMTVLASRQHLCVNPSVSTLPGYRVNSACRKARNDDDCEFYSNVNAFNEAAPLQKGVTDIEDLKREGAAGCVCPYYLGRDRAHDAQLIFASYNHVLDPMVRGSLTGALGEQPVIIFDEAHNLEDQCMSTGSVDVARNSILLCLNSNTVMSPVRDVLQLMADVLLQQIPKSRDKPTIKPGLWIYDFVEMCGVPGGSGSEMVKALETSVQDAQQKGQTRVSAALQHIKSLFCLVFEWPVAAELSFADFSSYYKCIIQLLPDGDIGLGFWCLSPSVAIKCLKKTLNPRSILCASGTLAPLQGFSEELGLEFRVRLENPHVIQRQQLWAGVISQDSNNRALTSEYKQRGRGSRAALAEALTLAFRRVPKGLLVFFPSYSEMDACVEQWKMTGKLAAFMSHKKLYIETRSSETCDSLVGEYRRVIKDEGGAAFFAVTRGKLSEGIDFSDDEARGVVIAGMPMPNVRDPKMNMKKMYVRETRGARAAEEWYTQQATRAVNQAIGRVIRHKHDWGAIMMFEERFGRYLGNNPGYMSKWLRPNILDMSKFGKFAVSLGRFFQGIGAVIDALPKPASPAKLASHTRPTALSASRPPPLNQAQKARKFLTLAKSMMTASSFSKFQALLQKNRRREITVLNLAKHVFQLFRANVDNEAEREKLCEGFLIFVPSAERFKCRQLIVKNNSVSGPPPVEQQAAAFQKRVRIASKTAEAVVKKPKADAEPCVLCNNKMITPRAAPCEHIACHNCWMSWLTINSVCPCQGCKMPLKRKNLRVIHF